MPGRSGGRSGGGSRGSSGRSSGLGRGSSGRSMGSRGSAGRSLRSSNNNRSRSLGGHGGSLFGGSSSFGGNTHPRNNSAGSFLGGYLMGKATSNRSSSRHHIPRHSHYDMGNRNQGSGCFTKLLLGAIVLFFLFLVFSGSLASCSQGYNYNSNTANSNKENITPNRTKREPLQKGFVKETEYYEDNLDWISNPTKLTIGLKNFYNLTGIQPYLLLIDTIGSNPSDNDIDAYANRYYDNHFEDEAHLLFIYIEDIDYMYGIVGSSGLTVMDQEAWDILFDYVEMYIGSTLDEDELFSTAFHKAGERIMSDPNEDVKIKSKVYIFLIVGVVVVLAMIFYRNILKEKKEREAREAKDLKEMLNKPLETFGKSEVDDLMDKYDK